MGRDPPVVVVDADHESGVRTADAIDRHGYEATVADSDDVEPSTVSREHDRDGRVACVVTEIDVGPYPGLEFASAVSDRHPDVGVVVYTDGGDESVASRAFAVGVDDYVPKSGGTERLLDAVDRSVAGDRDDGIRVPQLLDAVTSSTPGGVVLADPDGRIRRANERARTLLGVDDALEGVPLAAEPWSVETVDGDAGTTDDPFTRVCSTERTVTDARVPVDAPDGARRYLSVDVTTLGTGPLEGWSVFTMDDRTAQVERERDLERYRTIVETVGDMIYVLDEAGRITLANHAFAGFFDRRPSDLVGTDVGELVSERTYETGTELIETLLSTDETDLGRYEIAIEGPEGTERYFENNVAILSDGDGEFGGSVGVIREITGRVRQERLLERQNERLAEFTDIVSHDLRNPLNVIDGRLDLLAETGDESHLEAIEAATERMEELIADLLELARQGKRIDELRPVAIDDVATEAWRGVETPGARLDLRDGLGTVEADRTRLRQCFENLFRNAIEHGSTGGDRSGRHKSAVTVTVEATDGGFAVRDDGPGIDPADVDRVFDRGFTTRSDGTGFGLGIVRRIVEAHGWSIRVDRAYDDGARFVVDTSPQADVSSGATAGSGARRPSDEDRTSGKRRVSPDYD